MSNKELLVKKSWLIKNQNSNISDNYDIDFNKPLGNGAFGTVLKGKVKGTNLYRAIKQIPKNKV